MTEEQIDQLSLRHGGSRMSGSKPDWRTKQDRYAAVRDEIVAQRLHLGDDLAPHTLREIEEADADRRQA